MTSKSEFRNEMVVICLSCDAKTILKKFTSETRCPRCSGDKFRFRFNIREDREVE